MSEHDVLTDPGTDPRRWPARSLLECVRGLQRLARHRRRDLVGGLDLDEAVREIARRLRQHQDLIDRVRLAPRARQAKRRQRAGLA